jgi:hypothetical protein
VSPGATRALRGRQESRAEGREALQHATVLARSADLSPALGRLVQVAGAYTDRNRCTGGTASARLDLAPRGHGATPAVRTAGAQQLLQTRWSEGGQKNLVAAWGQWQLELFSACTDQCPVQSVSRAS